MEKSPKLFIALMIPIISFLIVLMFLSIVEERTEKDVHVSCYQAGSKIFEMELVERRMYFYDKESGAQVVIPVDGACTYLYAK